MIHNPEKPPKCVQETENDTKIIQRSFRARTNPACEQNHGKPLIPAAHSTTTLQYLILIYNI